MSRAPSARWVEVLVAGGLLVALGAGCTRAAAETNEKPPLKEIQLVSPRKFDGLVIPTKATELRAPQNSLKLRSWSMASSWIKLADLPEDGKAVEKGDEVARFEFRGKRAWPGVRENIDRARADKEQSALQLETELREMLTELKRRELDAAMAKLDLQKEGSVSARRMALFQQAYEQAKFEAEALEKRIAVHRRRMASDRAYRDAELKRAEAERDRLAAYEQAFTITAPHKGVLRHGHHRHRRRKVEKGDGMPSGYNFSAVALDASVSVEFFVPEQRVDELEIGQRVTVHSPVSDETFPAVVREIATFPQEIGFLRKNSDLANAREKAFVVRAEFDEFPEQLTAGLEIKVEL